MIEIGSKINGEVPKNYYKIIKAEIYDRRISYLKECVEDRNRGL